MKKALKTTVTKASQLVVDNFAASALIHGAKSETGFGDDVAHAERNYEADLIALLKRIRALERQATKFRYVDKLSKAQGKPLFA